MSTLSGTVQDGLKINNGELVEVGLDGVVSNTRVFLGGTLYLLDGSYAENTTVTGVVYMKSGAKSNNTVIQHRGIVYVQSGAVAENVVNYSDGKLYIQGGTASVVFNPWHGTKPVVSDGGTLIELERDAAIYVGGESSGIIQKADVIDGLALDSGEEAIVYNGGIISNAILGYGASMRVENGATVDGINISAGGILTVSEGACINGIDAESNVTFNITINKESRLSGIYDNKEFTVCDGFVKNFTIDQKSQVTIAADVEATGTVVAGNLTIENGCRIMNTEVQDFSYLTLSAGAVAENSSIGGSVGFYLYGTHRGTLNISESCEVVIGEEASVDFTVAGRMISDDYLITNISKLNELQEFTITVSAFQAGGTYKLASEASAFSKNVTIGDGTSVYGVLTVNGEAVVYGTRSYKLVRDGEYLTLEVVSSGSDNFNSAQWEETADAESYIIEYSTDNFATAVCIVSETNALNTAGLTAGRYQWRVKATGSSEWIYGDDIVIAAPEEDTAQLFDAADDGKKDVFFASVKGNWRVSHKARHSGTIEFGSLTWEGTNETVRLSNKGKIADCFAGAGEDANTLYLTDNSNGEALFVDDIFSELPDAVTGQARIAQIKEICCGAGGDLVDMTSQRFFYTGSGVVIRGGDGDDTVWANKGENILLGDSGNDRLVGAGGNDVLAGGEGNDSMHGGGGNDIFTFCADWGRDTIEQLASGSVTLWFENEMELSFEETADGTLITAADGSSIFAENMSLTLDDCRFGAAGFEDEFARLSDAGAFEKYSSTKIFTITA